MRNILVIDDREAELNELAEALRENLDCEALVTAWRPGSDLDADPLDELAKRVTPETALIVTDFDLTATWRGFFGSSIVAWAKSHYFPVCNFSRNTPDRISKVPDLFEFRLSSVPSETARDVAWIFRGFSTLRELVANIPRKPLLSSPAQTLAVALGRSAAESEFAPYFSRVGSANGSLIELMQRSADSKRGMEDEGRDRLLTYVIGHVLCNAILRYPGPLMDERALSAYVGQGSQSREALGELFQAANFEGPFSTDRKFFWRTEVDSYLETLPKPSPWDEFAPVDVQNQALVDAALSNASSRHDCSRCDGERGGFWCPFSQRAVCERDDCSVTSSSWIPDGAWLTRVEKDFYDEWAPMLGY